RAAQNATIVPARSAQEQAAPAKKPAGTEGAAPTASQQTPRTPTGTQKPGTNATQTAQPRAGNGQQNAPGIAPSSPRSAATKGQPNSTGTAPKPFKGERQQATVNQKRPAAGAAQERLRGPTNERQPGASRSTVGSAPAAPERPGRAPRLEQKPPMHE